MGTLGKAAKYKRVGGEILFRWPVFCAAPWMGRGRGGGSVSGDGGAWVRSGWLDAR